MGQQYLDNGWFGIAIVGVLVAFLLFNIARAKRGKDLFIRRIPGLNSIDEAIGRATELGKPVLMVPGVADPINAKAMQAINIFSHVVRIAARFSNPILFCCASSSVYTVSQEVVRDVYQQEGLSDRYDMDSVRFLSDRQFAFAAGTAGLIMREQVAACFFMGEFYAESLIFAETANRVGAIQVASSTELTQTPFFIAACDYVLIGDEFYAASAYLTRQPVLVGSLVGQDWCKLLIIFLLVFGTLFNSVAIQGRTTTQVWKEGKYVSVPERPMQKSDTFISRLLNPDPDPNLKVTDRPQIPKDELPVHVEAGGGGS
jgi:hypothetical protein